MIILDPDLDPSAAADAPQANAARRTDGSARRTAAAGHRLPSARSLERFLREASAAVKLRGQVTVLLTTDAAMRRLNRRFRGKDKATDVLSFSAGVPVAVEIAGDLAISVPTARRQAVERGHSIATELKVLMLHGLLHLAGYDHETDQGEMYRRERTLRAKLGLPQGLIERAGEAVEALRPKSKQKPRVARSARP
jgi:probable rRNA maturation factor